MGAFSAEQVLKLFNDGKLTSRDIYFIKMGYIIGLLEESENAEERKLADEIIQKLNLDEPLAIDQLMQQLNLDETLAIDQLAQKLNLDGPLTIDQLLQEFNPDGPLAVDPNAGGYPVVNNP